jgi:hypothetical protein
VKTTNTSTIHFEGVTENPATAMSPIPARPATEMTVLSYSVTNRTTKAACKRETSGIPMGQFPHCTPSVEMRFRLSSFHAFFSHNPQDEFSRAHQVFV